MTHLAVGCVGEKDEKRKKRPSEMYIQRLGQKVRIHQKNKLTVSILTVYF